MNLIGLHHLTAVSSRIGENARFYTGTMGMRLVKRSVNQDDVSAYHLFYADAAGTPGTDLTFFDWRVPRERRGTHSIIRTALRVRDEASLSWWKNHLAAAGTATSDVVSRGGRATLDFEDPEGQRLSLVVDGGLGDPSIPWDRSPVPSEHQLRGLGPVTLSVPRLEPTEVVLTRVMGMTAVDRYDHPENSGGSVHIYQMGEGGPHAEVHVAVEPHLPPAAPGAGGVHHVAFRTPDPASQEECLRILRGIGLPSSGVVDRYYFRSLYFREPNGLLFEIATDGPGFAVDEDPATLGESLALPPFLEPRRKVIEDGLIPLEL